MATTTQKLRISEEPDIPAGPLRINYKLIWITLALAVGFAALIATALLGNVLIGIVFCILVMGLYATLVGVPWFENWHTTLLAKLYRSGSHKLLGMFGVTRYASNQPLAGERVGGVAPRNKHVQPPAIKMLGRIDILPYTVRQEDAEGQLIEAQLGVARDRRYQTRAATLQMKGSSLLSVDEETRRSRMSAFGSLLDHVGESGLVHRLAWRDQTLMGEVQEPLSLVKHLQASAGLQPRGTTGLDSFTQHLNEMCTDAVPHRETFTLSVYGPSIKRQAKVAGSQEEVLLQQLRLFYQSVMGDGNSPIGLRAAQFLSFQELVLENRLALDPVFAKREWNNLIGRDVPQGTLTAEEAWPEFADFGPDDFCKLGETFHKGFYVAKFAENGILPDNFWELLEVPVPKTVTTVVQMVPPTLARLRAEYTTTGARGRNVDRVTANRRITEADQVAAESVTEHEREIAQSRGRVARARIYVDVTGKSLEEVNAHADAVQKAVINAHFKLRPLVGRQQLGIDAVMPLARGLAAIPLDQWV
jgi:hypothetical protein